MNHVLLVLATLIGVDAFGETTPEFSICEGNFAGDSAEFHSTCIFLVHDEAGCGWGIPSQDVEAGSDLSNHFCPGIACTICYDSEPYDEETCKMRHGQNSIYAVETCGEVLEDSYGGNPNLEEICNDPESAELSYQIALKCCHSRESACAATQGALVCSNPENFTGNGDYSFLCIRYQTHTEGCTWPYSLHGQSLDRCDPGATECYACYAEVGSPAMCLEEGFQYHEAVCGQAVVSDIMGRGQEQMCAEDPYEMYKVGAKCCGEESTEPLPCDGMMSDKVCGRPISFLSTHEFSSRCYAFFSGPRESVTDCLDGYELVTYDAGSEVSITYCGGDICNHCFKPDATEDECWSGFAYYRETCGMALSSFFQETQQYSPADSLRDYCSSD